MNKNINMNKLVNMLKDAIIAVDDGRELNELVEAVCDRLNMPMLKTNPLFSRTISALRN